MHQRSPGGPLGAALVMSLGLVACQREASHDPVRMYFVAEEPGRVHLVIEPNPVIRPGAELTIRNENQSVWVGGLTNPFGGFTSAPFDARVGDTVTVTAWWGAEWLWETCVLVGNYGSQPDSCD
jgi:hypothetical protein